MIFFISFMISISIMMMMIIVVNITRITMMMMIMIPAMRKQWSRWVNQSTSGDLATKPTTILILKPFIISYIHHHHHHHSSTSPPPPPHHHHPNHCHHHHPNLRHLNHRHHQPHNCLDSWLICFIRAPPPAFESSHVTAQISFLFFLIYDTFEISCVSSLCYLCSVRESKSLA